MRVCSAGGPRSVTCWRKGSVFAAMVCLMLAGSAAAQFDKAETCLSETDEAKSGLCGHALTDIALLQAPAGFTTLAAAPDTTDITHVFLDFEVLTGTTKKLQGSVTFDVTSTVN